MSLQYQAAPGSSGGPKRLRRFLLWVAICVLFSENLPAQLFKEYDLKALFLYNFTQFVEWPADAFASTNSPIIIGVLGPDHFGKSLDDLIQTETPSKRQLKVERSRKFSDLQNCHILFIDQSESANLDEIFRKCCGKPILTVSDMEGFSKRGGMIQFITDEKQKKIRLRINTASAKDAHLTISSKLLKLAEIE